MAHHSELAPKIKSDHPKLDAFLSRLVLRLFNDAPGLSAYYVDSCVKSAGKFKGKLVLIFQEIPKEVMPALYTGLACQDIKVYKFGDGPTVKVAYVITPSKEELSDLDLYPMKQEQTPAEVKSDMIPDPS